VRVDGRVERSVLFPGVVVDAGAHVKDSILMHGTRVGRGAVVERAIADKGVRIGEGARVGGPAAPGLPENRICPEHLASGLTLVGKSAAIAAGVTVGRNCRVDPEVTEDMWTGDMPDGEWIASPPGSSPSHGAEPAPAAKPSAAGEAANLRRAP
jgi:glucose-1-phosphate adenylyltransferase